MCVFSGSLLLEDSDEEEGDLCRICQMGQTSSLNPLIEPCRCTGSLQYVHQDCIKKWLRSKISSGQSPLPTPLPSTHAATHTFTFSFKSFL